jgi:DNA-binding NarL/FixJ family response regulator
VSASSDADVAKEARDAGASAFVHKAAAANDLVPAIQRAIASRPT